MLDHPAFLSWRGGTGCPTSVSPRGTEGSNPSPSTGESASSGRRCRAACRQHFARILGVTSRRYRRRTDEIAEHDRELVALSVASALRCGRGLRRPGDSFDYQLPATAAKPRYRLVLKAARRAGNGQSRGTLSAKAPRLCVFSHAARATHKALRGGDRSPQPYLTGGSLRLVRIHKRTFLAAMRAEGSVVVSGRWSLFALK